nr:uronyl 2-sulfotransferase [Aotus nancymaae]
MEVAGVDPVFTVAADRGAAPDEAKRGRFLVIFTLPCTALIGVLRAISALWIVSVIVAATRCLGPDGKGPTRLLFQYFSHLELTKDLTVESKLGNSTYLDDHGPPPSKVLPFPSQVVYNRVGKCGSRTVVLLLRILSEKHGFNLVTSDIHNKTRLTKNEQMELIKNISTAEQPYLFTRHVHFLNFSRFGGDQPVYINIIRDPVNRFLSNYFFRRFGDWRGEQNHMIRTPSMRQEERYLDINECILENYPECSNPRLFYIIPYFCGQHPRCREPGEWALERAKLNVNENFLLVGILEELEDVLLLLERFLPHYFKGVLSIYKDPEHRKLGNMTVTVKKTVPSPEAVQILYQRMRYEYEFYHYVKEQFHLLKRKFGLKSRVSKPPLRPHFFIPTPLETDEPIDDEEQDDEKWLEDIYKR